jgi:hypothetical protein
MRRAHAIAAIVEEAAGQESSRTSEPDLPGDGVGGEFFLHGLEQCAREDRLMLAPMHLIDRRIGLFDKKILGAEITHLEH